MMIKTHTGSTNVICQLIQEKRRVNVEIPKILFSLARSVARTLMRRPSVCLYVNPGGFAPSAAFPGVKF